MRTVGMSVCSFPFKVLYIFAYPERQGLSVHLPVDVFPFTVNVEPGRHNPK